MHVPLLTCGLVAAHLARVGKWAGRREESNGVRVCVIQDGISKDLKVVVALELTQDATEARVWKDKRGKVRAIAVQKHNALKVALRGQHACDAHISVSRRARRRA